MYRISRQDIMNFVGAHPRLMTLLTGLGITVAFAWMGKFFVNEALATSASASLSSASTSMSHADFQIDYVTKTPIQDVPGYKPVLFACKCDNCEGASDFAPGIESWHEDPDDPGGAEDFAPGHIDDKDPELDPEDVAPGQLKKKEID